MIFLCGTKAGGYKGGLLTKPGQHRILPDSKNCVSLSSARQFTLSLGFSYQELKKGTFNDKHEDVLFQVDRRERFILRPSGLPIKGGRRCNPAVCK